VHFELHMIGRSHIDAGLLLKLFSPKQESNLLSACLFIYVFLFLFSFQNECLCNRELLDCILISSTRKYQKAF
jgi:hypothetical protein